MSDSPEFVTTLTLVDNASKVLDSIEASAKKVAGVFDVLLGIENKLSGFDRPLDRISDGMSNVADSTLDAQKAVSQLNSGLDDLERSTKRLSIGDVFKTIASNGANIFGIVQMASGMLNGFQSAMKTVDDNTNLIARLGAVARNEGIAIENKEAWQGRAEEIRQMLSKQAISLGLDSTAYANNAITFANNPAFKSIEEASRFSELMSKQFFASGVGGQAQMSVVNQLTQGLGKGRLQGEDLMSILSNAPDMGRLLEEAYARVNHVELDKVTGHVRELASEGKLTADVIKDAFFGAAEKIEANFEEMPNTFEDMLTKFKDKVFETFQPVMQLLMRIGNSDEFKSMLDSVSSIIGSVMNVVDRLSPVLGLAMMAADKVLAAADAIITGILSPFEWAKDKKESPKILMAEMIAIDQRMKIYQSMKEQIALLRDNSDAINALADIQKTFNERTKGLFNYDTDLSKRQEDWLKDYQRSHAEEALAKELELYNIGPKGTNLTNYAIEEMRARQYEKIAQGSIFNRDQYLETQNQLADLNRKIANREKALRKAGALAGDANSFGGRLLAQGVADSIDAELRGLYRGRDAAQKELALYDIRINEWLGLIADNTDKTAKNTRRVSINRDDILFLKNIATAQIIYNYNNNTNTANFNQSFGSGSPAQVKKASQDGWSKAMRGTSSAL